MNTYELTVVIPEGDEVKRLIKVVNDFAKKTKGEVNKHESWGVKQLAYPIRKLEKAQYEHFLLSLDPSKQVELDKALRMDESILRYMFVRV